MSALLPAERGTRILFGKPYHWHRDGRLYLVGGPAETCQHNHDLTDPAARRSSPVGGASSAPDQPGG